jgi:mannitol-specific phosphotransferase system IIBC component
MASTPNTDDIQESVLKNVKSVSKTWKYSQLALIVFVAPSSIHIINQQPSTYIMIRSLFVAAHSTATLTRSAPRVVASFYSTQAAAAVAAATPPMVANAIQVRKKRVQMNERQKFERQQRQALLEQAHQWRLQQKRDEKKRQKEQRASQARLKSELSERAEIKQRIRDSNIQQHQERQQAIAALRQANDQAKLERYITESRQQKLARLEYISILQEIEHTWYVIK